MEVTLGGGLADEGVDHAGQEGAVERGVWHQEHVAVRGRQS